MSLASNRDACSQIGTAAFLTQHESVLKLGRNKCTCKIKFKVCNALLAHFPTKPSLDTFDNLLPPVAQLSYAWPSSSVFEIRISINNNVLQLWSIHKYSLTITDWQQLTICLEIRMSAETYTAIQQSIVGNLEQIVVWSDMFSFGPTHWLDLPDQMSDKIFHISKTLPSSLTQSFKCMTQ